MSARPRSLAAPVLAAQQRAVGMALVEAGRSEATLPLLEPLAGGGDPALLDALALALSDGGREIAPDYWEALYNVGLASAELGRKSEARQALERFVGKAPPELFRAELAKARTLLGELRH